MADVTADEVKSTPSAMKATVKLETDTRPALDGLIIVKFGGSSEFEGMQLPLIAYVGSGKANVGATAANSASLLNKEPVMKRKAKGP
jgi:hypothetical protein